MIFGANSLALGGLVTEVAKSMEQRKKVGCQSQMERVASRQHWIGGIKKWFGIGSGCGIALLTVVNLLSWNCQELVNPRTMGDCNAPKLALAN